MTAETVITIKNKFSIKVKNGFPLIEKEAILNLGQLKEEGSILKLVNEQNQFVGYGYYGKQNKGMGWILSTVEKEEINGQFIKGKLEQAMKRRHQFYSNEQTTAFRVFNGEGDGIGGLIIDYYDGYYVIHWYSEGIYKFRQHILDYFITEVKFKGLYQKKRFDSKGMYMEEDDFITGDRGKIPLVVKENGVNFAVYLNDGAMVGVFLDQREVRKTLRDHYVKGKTVLNMFSYTGAFSVFSALGGATKTTSVDVANRSLEKTREQFSINGVDPTSQGIIVEDVFHYFKYAAKKQMKFDVVILDPPSFAKSKKHTFSASKNYKDLVKDTIQITSDGGLIVASTNCSSFDMKKFKSFIDVAFGESGRSYTIEEEFHLPEDFRTIKEYKEGNYLKVLFVRIKNE